MNEAPAPNTSPNFVRRLSVILSLPFGIAGAIVAATSAQAQTFTSLYSFDYPTNSSVESGLIQATDGNLYGTTGTGGAVHRGTIFKITTEGAFTTLHSFSSSGGYYPQAAGLIQATNGNFYGDTAFGGADADPYGSIFELTPSGKLTTVSNFCYNVPNCIHGNYPHAGVIQATDGSFYGTTPEGGAASYGTVFKVTAAGALTTLYSFCSPDCTYGSGPQGGLIQGKDGNFYGTTQFGGAYNAGSVFKITATGSLTTLYSFCPQAGCLDGLGPYSSLVQAIDGNFYGTTYEGGTYNGGTIFKITPSGTLTTIYTFCSLANCADGGAPQAGLIQATDGNFYGTTTGGGANNTPVGDGTIFQMTPGGTLTTLYRFCPQGGTCTDGAAPAAPLVQDTNGTFYGTTYGGGTGTGGTIFSLSMGLGPFVATQTTSGPVGSVVRILGTDLGGTSSVTFSGAPAIFTVVSASQITATVPSGATTGVVAVTTPTGVLLSNVPFTVSPSGQLVNINAAVSNYNNGVITDPVTLDLSAGCYFVSDVYTESGASYAAFNFHSNATDDWAWQYRVVEVATSATLLYAAAPDDESPATTYATKKAAAKAGQALAAGSFCLDGPTTVGFVIDDTLASDNTGGISVAVSAE